MNDLVVLYTDDWEALFVNCDKVIETREVSISEIRKYCPINSIKAIWVSDFFERWILDVNGSHFPETLDLCFEIDPPLKEELSLY